MKVDQNQFVQLGAVRFAPAARVLTDAHGAHVALRPQSLAVLIALVEKAGELAERDHLIAEVWGDVAVTDDSLIQCIADIRRVLGDEGHKIVQTVPKKGYRLIASESAVAPTVPTRGRRRRPTVPLAAAAVLVVVLMAAVWFWPATDRSGRNGAAIAVLPFADLGGNEGQAYFIDGFTLAITTNISKFENLFVVSSYSAFKYRDTDKSPSAIAQELGVRYLLTGGVQSVRDRLVINAQLTDTANGKTLWAERYDAPRGDVFTLQDDLSAKIAATLVESVESETTRRVRLARRTSLSAYELVLRAATPKIEKAALTDAIGLIEQAIGLDPEFARAYAELANVNLLMWRHSLADDPDESLRRARAAAARAIELDVNSYVAYQVLSQIYLYADQDHAQSLAAITKALEINPNEADLMIRMATVLGFMNRDNEAIGWIEKAMRQNPRHPAWYSWNAAFVYAVAGKNERAIVESKKALAVYGTSASIRRILIAAYGQLDQWDEARRYGAEIMALYPDFRLSTQMRNSPFQDPDERAHFWDIFRSAGLPD